MLAVSNSWCVRDPFKATSGFLCRPEGHFWPGKRYSPALSNHQISNLRGSCDLPQPKAAKPDLWDGAMSSPPRDAKNVSWGCSKISVDIPRSCLVPKLQFFSKWWWSLLLQYYVWGMQDDEPPNWCKSNSKILTWGIQANLGFVHMR